MTDQQISPAYLSEFLKYLALNNKDGERLPTLAELSVSLGVSIASLREQLEVARVLGLVEVKPKTGIRRAAYSFLPAIRQSVGYALMIDEKNFALYADLRRNIEMAYFREAISLLSLEDRQNLQRLVARAQEKLKRRPAQLPHVEHRELHLSMYGRLNNPFVTGLLQAYWDLYEAAGLAMFTDYAYLQQVWQYHQRLVDAICTEDVNAAFRVLIDHMGLLSQRASTVSQQNFE